MEHQLQIAQATDRLTGQNRVEISSSGSQEQKARRGFKRRDIPYLALNSRNNSELGDNFAGSA